LLPDVALMLRTAQPELGSTLAWLLSHGYSLMFVAMIFEGPLVIMAASFAASMGYFNLWIIIVLSVAGDLTGDLIWFALGRFGRIAFQHRVRRRFSTSQESMHRIGQLIEQHPGKALVAIKLAPFAAVPGLAAIGASRLSLLKFISFTLLIIAPKTAVFVVLGYLFRHTYGVVALYLRGQAYAAVIVVILALLCYYTYRGLASRISKNLGE
jgi:membrane protein DedA with SNARE-associated domain